MLHDSDETDDVIFLLSTDWFTSWIVSMDQWRGGQTSIEHTKNVARRAASGILSGAADYYHVDLSPARKAASFDRFMKELSPGLDERQARDLDRLLSSITGDSLLSREQRWALKAVLVREVSRGFGSDARSALGEGVVIEVMRTLELLGVGEIPFQPDSWWDVELDGKFGGLAGRLGDYASSAHAPSVLLKAVAGATRRLEYSPLDMELLANWWADATQEFSMYVDPTLAALLATRQAPDQPAVRRFHE
ncbi:hypothetical protein [Stenotrophomonas oahuensis]|uniref:Uncharacterized protein n=1 Tax=Stenotrophomonas oahuensis TaxID=3003271 RepID=A0ABY9YRZ9_9GAMM|nr:hypothetical protein [Stenotrophomonas sp. A5586]WNH53210.1 hypothetical protein PDM29_02740 [Stenotrophomonas sp. A5586]